MREEILLLEKIERSLHFLRDQRVINDVDDVLVEILTGDRNLTGVLRVQSPLRPLLTKCCETETDDKQHEQRNS